MVQLILKKIEYGNVIIEMYDDTDVWMISYDALTPEQQKKYDEVDLIDTSLYTDA
jgi:hypothetical protein